MSAERRGVVVTLGAQIAQIAVGVLTSTMIGRALGPETYGVVNVLRNANMLALTLTPLGLDVALLKYLGTGGADSPAKAAAVARLRGLAFAVSAALWLAVVFAAGLGEIGRLYPLPHIDALAMLALAALPFATDAAILGAVYRAERRVARFAWLSAGAQSAFRLAAIPLALSLIPSTAIVVAIGTAQSALSSLLLWLDRRKRVQAFVPVRSHAIAGILAESRWMALSVFVAAVMRSADVLFLGALAPAREVGAYAAVAMVSQLIAIFPMAASQTLGPRVASAYASRAPGAVQLELNRYLRVATPVSAFLFGGIVAFGPCLDLIFGRAYVFDPVVCFLIPLGQLLSAGLGPMGFALSMTGRHRSEIAILTAGGGGLAWVAASLCPPTARAERPVASWRRFCSSISRGSRASRRSTVARRDIGAISSQRLWRWPWRSVAPAFRRAGAVAIWKVPRRAASHMPRFSSGAPGWSIRRGRRAFLSPHQAAP